LSEARVGPLVAGLGRAIGWITNAAMALSALGILASLVMVAYAVVMRYVFNSAPTWVDDSVGFTLVGVVMLAAASTLRQGGHISVDMLTDRLGARGKRRAEIWATFSVLLVSLILIVNGWQTAMSSRAIGISTSGNVELPVYLLELLLPLGGVLMLLVSVEGLLRLALGLPPAVAAPAQAAPIAIADAGDEVMVRGAEDRRR
jgi:TRAP-type C4-dicarboxylate transport system permease small subunit